MVLHGPLLPPSCRISGFGLVVALVEEILMDVFLKLKQVLDVVVWLDIHHLLLVRDFDEDWLVDFRLRRLWLQLALCCFGALLLVLLFPHDLSHHFHVVLELCSYHSLQFSKMGGVGLWCLLLICVLGPGSVQLFELSGRIRLNRDIWIRDFPSRRSFLAVVDQPVAMLRHNVD